MVPRALFHCEDNGCNVTRVPYLSKACIVHLGLAFQLGLQESARPGLRSFTLAYIMVRHEVRETITITFSKH